MMDFIITNGTVVDGTGAAPFVGDVVRDPLGFRCSFPRGGSCRRCFHHFQLYLTAAPLCCFAAAAAQAIKDGRIAAVGEGLVEAGMTAKETYDATGLHVAPGWIDPHTHFVRSARAAL